MATLPSSTLRFSKPIPKFPSPPPHSSSPFKFLYPPRAAAEDDSSSESSVSTSTTSSSSSSTADQNDDSSFENRLSQVRIRYKSGTGKKAEVRKSRKGGGGGKKTSGSGSSVFLPPVALKEPVSEGLNVEFGFSPYSERINGRIAILGLSALILVELATGEGVIKYHSPAIIFLQLYFVAAVSALYVKYEKEKVSVWPK